VDSEAGLPSQCGYGFRDFDQLNDWLPGHYRLHLKEEFLALDLLLNSGPLVIGEAEFLATHHQGPELSCAPISLGAQANWLSHTLSRILSQSSSEQNPCLAPPA